MWGLGRKASKLDVLKLFLFIGDIILYIILNNSHKKNAKQVELIEFSKVTGYQINIQKSVVFL